MNCGECGTEFPAPPAAESFPDEPVTAVECPVAALADLDMGYRIAEGFSRPDWKAIHEFVRQHVPRDELGPAWNYVAFKWLEELSADWGGGCRIRASEHFYCLSDVAASPTRTLLNYAETTVATIRSFLGSASCSCLQTRMTTSLTSPIITPKAPTF